MQLDYATWNELFLKQDEELLPITTIKDILREEEKC